MTIIVQKYVTWNAGMEQMLLSSFSPGYCLPIVVQKSSVMFLSQGVHHMQHCTDTLTGVHLPLVASNKSFEVTLIHIYKQTNCQWVNYTVLQICMTENKLENFCSLSSFEWSPNKISLTVTFETSNDWWALDCMACYSHLPPPCQSAPILGVRE